MGSFSHKSCHPPNKAIKMFVCIIEGKVLPWVSFKAVVCTCILKNTCSLGRVPAEKFLKKKKVICLRKAYFIEFTFSFSNTQKSVIPFLIAQPRCRWERVHCMHAHTVDVCLAACLRLCIRVCAVLCSSFVFGDHLQLSTIL